MTELTLARLREANSNRQDQWDHAQHKLSLSYFGNAFAGEIGEVLEVVLDMVRSGTIACNTIKKIDRETLGLRGSRATTEQLADELADVIIYMDLLAQKAGINLDEAVIRVFNRKSKELKLKERL